MNETSIKAALPELLGAAARWTAAVRARESLRDDRLFGDPWAAALASEEGQAWLKGRSPESAAPMVIRTHLFDDFLRPANLQGAISQVVLVAAGLDTRAFQVGRAPGTRLFELDQSPILECKHQLRLYAHISVVKEVAEVGWLLSVGSAMMRVKPAAPALAPTALPREHELPEVGYGSHP